MNLMHGHAIVILTLLNFGWAAHILIMLKALLAKRCGPKFFNSGNVSNPQHQKFALKATILPLQLLVFTYSHITTIICFHFWLDLQSANSLF